MPRVPQEDHLCHRRDRGAGRRPPRKRLRRPLLPAALVLLALAVPARAAEPVRALLCRQMLHEEEVERDDQARELDLARVRAAAAADIFRLLQGLWDNDAVQRIVYLRGRYDRDILTARQRHETVLLQRQDALLEQYRRLCEAPAEPGESDRERIDAAHARYLAADCDARAVEVEMADLELAFRRELLAGLLDLEKNDVASKSDVILSRRDVEIAEVDLAQARRRVALCRAGGREAEDASAMPSPPDP